MKFKTDADRAAWERMTPLQREMCEKFGLTPSEYLAENPPAAATPDTISARLGITPEELAEEIKKEGK